VIVGPVLSLYNTKIRSYPSYLRKKNWCLTANNHDFIMALSKFHRWRCELANTMFLRVPQQNLPNYFGHVSVLQTNLAKSSASPIHCSENDLLLTSEIMSCPVKEFPCTYLGLPLSLQKPTNTEFLPLIEKVAHCWYSISLHR
jgi:hypothetical protein